MKAAALEHDPHPLLLAAVAHGGVLAEHAHAAAAAARYPSRISTVVVLPAPLGPSRPNTSPRRTSNERPRTASTAP